MFVLIRRTHYRESSKVTGTSLPKAWIIPALVFPVFLTSLGDRSEAQASGNTFTHAYPYKRAPYWNLQSVVRLDS